MAAWSIAYGREKEHAADLARGLATLPPDFLAAICGVCNGHGAYSQRFNHGCGMGSSVMSSGCDYCDGTGLLQGRDAAPASVREQVLTAAALSRKED